jgi:excisionase family DNA binding protein
MTQKPKSIPDQPNPELSRSKSSAQTPTRLLLPQEAAAYLAISTKTLKRLVSQGELRARRVRFELADLQAFVA